MVNDPNAWMDLQQQFQRLWQTLLQQGNSGSTDEHSPGSAWSQFGFGTNPSQLGPEVFSQWLNKSLRDLLGAPLQGWPFGGGVGSNPFANTGWSVMSPSEFVAMKDLPPLGSIEKQNFAGANSPKRLPIRSTQAINLAVI